MRPLAKAEGAGYYHVMSRVIERQMVLGRGGKEKFRKLMRLVSQFCEVDILTWTCLSNHWHILLYVRERPEVSDEGESEVVHGRGPSQHGAAVL